MSLLQVDSVLFWMAVTIYVIAASLGIFSIAFRSDKLLRVALWVTASALAVHGAQIVVRWVEVGHGPYIDRYEAMSSNAFVLAAVFLLAQLRYEKLRQIAPYILCIVVAIMGVAAVSPRAATDLPLTFDSYWLVIHIGFAKLANGSLLLGAACAGALLYKDAKERAGASNAFVERLPDLDWLDEFSYRLTAVGFIFLALMIGAGSIWAKKAWGVYWSWDAVETWSLVTWITYAVYLHLRRTFGWKGRKAAILLLGALCVAIISFFFIGVIFTGLHLEFLGPPSPGPGV